jgi:peptidoglycan hydrolase CwlO-like protein
MSNNQETLIQETKDLLETAQKEILKEISCKKNWLSKIFQKEDLSSLKQAQSSISKAINQIKNFVKDEAGLVIKLQKHLNEKNHSLKKLEEDVKQSQTETGALKDKIRFLEAEVQRLQNETTKTKPTISNSDQELKDRIRALEDSNQDLVKKYQLSQEELSTSQKLSVELSSRIRRLKSEIVSNQL